MEERGEEGVARPGKKGSGERGAFSGLLAKGGLFCNIRVPLTSDVTVWVTSGSQALILLHWVTPRSTLIPRGRGWDSQINITGMIVEIVK